MYTDSPPWAQTCGVNTLCRFTCCSTGCDKARQRNPMPAIRVPRRCPYDVCACLPAKRRASLAKEDEGVFFSESKQSHTFYYLRSVSQSLQGLPVCHGEVTTSY